MGSGPMNYESDSLQDASMVLVLVSRLLPHEVPIQYEFEVPKNMYGTESSDGMLQLMKSQKKGVQPVGWPSRNIGLLRPNTQDYLAKILDQILSFCEEDPFLSTCSVH